MTLISRNINIKFNVIAAIHKSGLRRRMAFMNRSEWSWYDESEDYFKSRNMFAPHHEQSIIVPDIWFDPVFTNKQDLIRQVIEDMNPYDPD